MTNDGIEADCREEHPLALGNLPLGPMVSSCHVGNTGCRQQWDIGGPNGSNRGGQWRCLQGAACASLQDCATVANQGGACAPAQGVAQ